MILFYLSQKKDYLREELKLLDYVQRVQCIHVMRLSWKYDKEDDTPIKGIAYDNIVKESY